MQTDLSQICLQSYQYNCTLLAAAAAATALEDCAESRSRREGPPRWGAGLSADGVPDKRKKSWRKVQTLEY